MHVPELGCSLWCKFPTFKSFFAALPWESVTCTCTGDLQTKPHRSYQTDFWPNIVSALKKGKEKSKKLFYLSALLNMKLYQRFPQTCFALPLPLALKCKIRGEEGLWFEVWLRQSAEGNQVPLFISVKLCTLMSKTRVCKYVHSWTGSFRNCRCDAVDVCSFITSNEIPF